MSGYLLDPQFEKLRDRLKVIVDIDNEVQKGLFSGTVSTTFYDRLQATLRSELLDMQEEATPLLAKFAEWVSVAEAVGSLGPKTPLLQVRALVRTIDIAIHPEKFPYDEPKIAAAIEAGVAEAEFDPDLTGRKL